MNVFSEIILKESLSPKLTKNQICPHFSPNRIFGFFYRNIILTNDLFTFAESDIHDKRIIRQTELSILKYI